MLILVYAASMLTAGLAQLPTRYEALAAAREGADARPLGQIMRQPVFLVAVICQMLGYGTMNLVMTATPLAMQYHEYGLGPTALVIQWHVLAMFAPSFITGHLIARIGMVPVLSFGALLGLGCVGVNLHGQNIGHFVAALVLLGISWNFLFVGGTTLLTRAYRPVEKARVQAANDVLVFGTVSITALSAGTVHHLFGWSIVNLSTIPMMIICLAAAFWLLRQPAVAAFRSPA